MKIILKKQGNCLFAMDLTAQEKLNSLSNNEYYNVNLTKPRNIKFHKKFFALMNFTLLHLPEDINIPTIDNLLDYIKLSLGHYQIKTIYKHEPIIELKSISFAAMDELAFKAFYNKALDVSIQLVCSERDTFLNQLVEFGG